MKINLSKGLSDEDKKELNRQFKAAYLFREQIIKVMEKEKEAIVTKMCADEEFGPNWEYEQAVRVAELRQLTKLISLFSN